MVPRIPEQRLRITSFLTEQRGAPGPLGVILVTLRVGPALATVYLHVMGFFRIFLGRDDDSSPSAGPIDSGALLREATANKAAGNVNGAIELLKRFWIAEPFGSSGYGVEAYLKLPMYLQVAGRRDEAWRTLNVLIADYVLSTPKLNDQVLPMMRSEIYDKMRLFWQREGEASSAVKYGILSHMNWLVGLHRQRRREELRDYASRETIEAVVKPLLKKAKLLHQTTAICDLVESDVRKLPNVDLNSLGDVIDRLVL